MEGRDTGGGAGARPAPLLKGTFPPWWGALPRPPPQVGSLGCTCQVLLLQPEQLLRDPRRPGKPGRGLRRPLGAGVRPVTGGGAPKSRGAAPRGAPSARVPGGSSFRPRPSFLPRFLSLRAWQGVCAVCCVLSPEPAACSSGPPHTRPSPFLPPASCRSTSHPREVLYFSNSGGREVPKPAAPCASQVPTPQQPGASWRRAQPPGNLTPTPSHDLGEGKLRPVRGQDGERARETPAGSRRHPGRGG